MGERRRIIEGRWTCSSCGTEGIPGRHKTCPACGSPREQEEMAFDFGARDAATGKAQAATVDDQALQQAAKAGADWLCLHCEAGNSELDAACKKCGAPKGSSPSAETRELPPPEAPEPEEEPEEPPRKKGGCGCLMGLLVLFVGCLGVLWWSGHTEVITGQVSARSWSRTVRIERFSKVTETGWRSELEGRPKSKLPVKGKGERAGVDDIRGCQRKQKGTKKVPDGKEEVCRTESRRVACGSHEECSVKDLGNGFAEEVCKDITDYCDEQYEACSMETRYRDEPVYGEQCSYSTYKWTEVKADTAKGKGDAPLAWPALEPAGDSERAIKSQQVSVSVTYDDGDGPEVHVEEREDDGWFNTWPMGAQVELDITKLGSVMHLRHPGEAQSELTKTK